MSILICLKPIGLLHLILVFLSTFVIVLAKAAPPGPPGSTGKSPTSNIAQPPIFPPVQAPQPHKGGGHHKKAPTPPPPAHPPTTKPPTPAPAPPPVKPPTRAPIPLPPRKLVAVQGVVYCNSCNYTGVETLLGATPLLGAVVKLQCNNTKSPIVVQTKSDKNGYFFINAPRNITTYGTHKCRVFIVSSPNKNCNKTTNLHNGVKGAILLPSATKPSTPVANFQLFNVGPFAFESSSSKKTCTR